MAGNVFIVIALIASLYSLYQYFKSYRGGENLSKARAGFHISSLSIIAASVVLLYLIVNHQYQYHYVYSYSSSNLSFGLLVSSFFAGQEGSFLLWALFSIIVGLIIISIYKRKSRDESAFMLGYIPTLSFLLAMVSPLLKNPFAYVYGSSTFIDTKFINPNVLNLSFIKNFIYSGQDSQSSALNLTESAVRTIESSGIDLSSIVQQGRGLNPMLENFWMQIHPPVLFLGFALAAVPFALAISALIRNEYSEWINEALHWTLATSLILGVGIMLGAYWAYGVLGWGGYWGWDPVENSSLVPWIVSVALIHTLIVQKQTQIEFKHGSYRKTNIALAAFTFILVIYSTFLTRSGILSDASVHSFTDPGTLVYTVLFSFLILFALITVIMIYFRRRSLATDKKNPSEFLSRENGLFYGSMLLLATATAILVGTSAPIFGRSVEIEFYNKMTAPLVVLMSVLIPVSLYLNWRKNETKLFLRKTLVSAVIGIVGTIVIEYFVATSNFIYILLLFVSVFTIAANIEFLIKSNKNILLLGGHITHIGFALFITGVLVNAVTSESTQLELQKGTTQLVDGKSVTYNGYKLVDGGKKYAFDITLKDDGVDHTITPIMYISEYNSSLMREPYIIAGIAKDIYLSPLSFQSGNANNQNTVQLKKGYTRTLGGVDITFEEFDLPEDAMSKMMNKEKFDIIAVITSDAGGESETQRILVNSSESKVVSFKGTETRIQILSFDVAGVLNVKVLEGDSAALPVVQEALTVELSEKHFISFVWIGVLIMVCGLIIVLIRRFSQSNQKNIL